MGAIDATALGDLVADVDIDELRARVHAHAPESIADRVLAASSEGEIAMSEEVSDIERRIVSDMRVPRVAASLATSGGLLAAALVMREGLGIVIPEGADPVPIYYAVIEKGLTLAGVAVFGGVACASLHRIAQRERKARIAELDALVTPLSRRLFGAD